MSLEHTQIISWGLSVPFCIFFLPSTVPGAGEEGNGLLMGDDWGVHNPQAHWKTNIPQTPAETLAFLKSLRCQSLLAFPDPSPRSASREPPGLLLCVALLLVF